MAQAQFSLDDEQQAKLKPWIEAQLAKAKTRDATGFRFAYTFTPTTLGTCVKVYDHHTKEEIDLTHEF